MFLLLPDKSAGFFAFQNGQSRNVTLTSNRLVNRLVSRSRFTFNRFSLQCRSLSVAATMLMVGPELIPYCRLCKSFELVRWRLIRKHVVAACISRFTVLLERNVNYLWKSIPKVHPKSPSGENIYIFLILYSVKKNY